MQIGVESRDGESLIENIVMEAMHDILESDDIDRLLDESQQKPPGLYETGFWDNSEAPNCNLLSSDLNEGTKTYVN